MREIPSRLNMIAFYTCCPTAWDFSLQSLNWQCISQGFWHGKDSIASHQCSCYRKNIIWYWSENWLSKVTWHLLSQVHWSFIWDNYITCERSLLGTIDLTTDKSTSKTSWFPNKGSSWVFENWVAPKLGGRSGLCKMGDSDILWSDL